MDEKDSEKDSEVHEGLEKEIEDLLNEEDPTEDTSSQKQVKDPDTEIPPDEGVDYGTEIPSKDVKKYGFD